MKTSITVSSSPPTFQNLPTWVVALIPVAIILVVLVFAVERAAEQRARGQVFGELRTLSKPYRVPLDGRELRDGSGVLAAVRRANHVNSHHSHPTQPIEVEINDGTHAVRIVIARNSQNADEYWVFRPGRNLLGHSLGQEMGRVTDPSLWRYLASF